MTFQPKHLGQTTVYPTTFDAGLLEAIPRGPGRAALGIEVGSLPFQGWDDWQAFEMGWLNSHGQGVSGVLNLRFSAESNSIVESKSLKLYLQSFHMTSFESKEQIQNQIQQDLQRCLDTKVILSLEVLPAEPFNLQKWQVSPWQQLELDRLVVALDQLTFSCSVYQPESALLQLDQTDHVNDTQMLYTDAFRSLCPVTGQPDFASIAVVAKGLKLNEKALGRYLNSFRLHQGFHEQCIEHIFMDLYGLGEFEVLSVIGRFTRRGGIDINPMRCLNSASEKIADYFQYRQWRQ